MKLATFLFNTPFGAVATLNVVLLEARLKKDFADIMVKETAL